MEDLQDQVDQVDKVDQVAHTTNGEVMDQVDHTTNDEVMDHEEADQVLMICGNFSPVDKIPSLRLRLERTLQHLMDSAKKWVLH